MDAKLLDAYVAAATARRIELGAECRPFDEQIYGLSAALSVGARKVSPDDVYQRWHTDGVLTGCAGDGLDKIASYEIGRASCRERV